MIIRYGGQEVSCIVRQNSSLRGRIRIHVYPNGDVNIEAPDNKELDKIKAAAQRRARWIFRRRDEALAVRRDVLPREYVSGETHFYLGRRYKLVIKENRKIRSEVKLLRGKIEMILPVADRAAVKSRLMAWYKARAKKYLGDKVVEICGRLTWTSELPSLKLIRMTTQWGSCSPEGTIYLNPALIRAPRHCIEYVIIHELCHLVEHNHSKKFFDLLTRQMPDWEIAKNELDSLAELILVGD